jgi:tRNA (mo5U34)-methyltransferase
MDEQEIRRLVGSVNTWHQTFEIEPGIRTPGNYDAEALLDRIALPQDLKGMRILDLGSNDGFFAATCVRRGAEVVAFDYRSKEASGFSVTEKVMGLSIPYIHDTIWNIERHELGTFDIILFLGVLYHLPDPFRAIELLSRCCAGELYLETAYTRRGTVPLMRYFPDRSLNDDVSNFWLPNVTCVVGMLEDCGFQVERIDPDPNSPYGRWRRAVDLLSSERAGFSRLVVVARIVRSGGASHRVAYDILPP